jgi:ABC-2 type transport system permease protein/oleandomycin transport system permease protein
MTARPVARPASPLTFLTDTGIITLRNVRRMVRTPQVLYFASLQPVVFLVLFRYVFGGAIHIPGYTYANYLLPGLLVEATLFGATTAVALAADLSGGLVDRFRSLPVARPAVLVARTLADFCRTAVVVAVVLAVGSLVGFRFANGALAGAAAIGLVLVFAYAYSWLLAVLGLAVKDPETAQLAGTLPILIFIFGSSLAVPVDTMPGWLQIFARNQPVSITMDAVRALTQGGPAAHWAWQSLAWSAALLVVLVPAATALYRRR